MPVYRKFHQAFNTDRAFIERVKFLTHIRTKRELLLIGADVIDEGYGPSRSRGSLQTVALAARLGIQCHIVSFSVNETPSSALAKRFLSLGNNTILVPRERISYKRLQQVGVANLRLGGDLAFLMTSASDGDIPQDILEFAGRYRGRMLGINLIGKVLGGQLGKSIWYPVFAQALALLQQKQDFGILLIPHDDLEDITDLRELSSILGEHLKKNSVHLLDPVPTAPVLKAVAGKCLHVITCRMHLAIATLGMGRPVTCFPYQGKFEGQFEHLQLSADGLWPMESLPKEPQVLAEQLRGRFEQSEAIAAHVRERLPTIQEFANKNFQGFSGFLEATSSMKSQDQTPQATVERTS